VKHWLLYLWISSSRDTGLWPLLIIRTFLNLHYIRVKNTFKNIPLRFEIALVCIPHAWRKILWYQPLNYYLVGHKLQSTRDTNISLQTKFWNLQAITALFRNTQCGCVCVCVCVTRGLHTLRITTTSAAPTAHRAEYLCYWFSFLTLLTMGEYARNM
jgi:hypothetical protein